MVCIQCRSETQVINSRHQKRTNHVWRRRQCTACRTIFSTLEVADYAKSWVVRTRSGELRPFSRDKLFLSLHASLQHRSDPVNDASGLVDTVMSQLQKHVKDARLDSRTIISTIQVVLNRFDAAASVHYQAFHK